MWTQNMPLSQGAIALKGHKPAKRGAQALAFSRERYAFASGDNQRAKPNGCNKGYD